MRGVLSDKVAIGRPAVIIAVGFVCALLGGCSVATQGAPARLFPVDKELQWIETELQKAQEAGYVSMDESGRAAYRNEIVAARMYAIDLQYTEFENALLRERQRVGFWATTAALGLNGAVPLTSSTWNKNVLSGAAEFVIGTQAAYNKEILLASTIQVVINTMRSSRDDVKSKILLKRGQTVFQYPLGDALADVEEYHRAGTFTSGVLEATQTTGAEAQRAEDNKAAIEISGVAADQSYADLRSYLYPGGAPSQERIATIRNLLKGRGEKRPLWLILQDPAAADLRTQLLRDAQSVN